MHVRTVVSTLALSLALLAGGCKPPSPKSKEPQQPSTRPTAVWEPRVLDLPPAEGRAEALVVVLHGAGDAPERFLPLAKAFVSDLPHAAFVVPEAILPAGADGARRWFQSRAGDAENVVQVREAGAQVSDWIDRELAKRSLPRDRLILLGFSQGATLASWLAVERKPAPAAVIALSGWLAIEGAPASSTRPEVLLVHGTADAVVPPALASEAASGLRSRGADVKLELIEGLGHDIDGRSIGAVKAFLARATPRDAGAAAP